MKTLKLILYNIRSTYNVGSILRTSDGLGIDEVIFTGYTPFFDKGLPHEQEKLRRQIHKTALGAEDIVKWRRIDDINVAINECRTEGQKIYALEQDEQSIILTSPHQYDDDVALILGEEVSGIPTEILKQCDEVLEIPMCGQKESFNVSVAAAIAAWELRKASLPDRRKHQRTPE